MWVYPKTLCSYHNSLVIVLLYLKCQTPQLVYHLRRNFHRKSMNKWSGRCLKHIMGNLIQLSHMSLTKKQWLNTLEIINNHPLMLNNKMWIVERDIQSICHIFVFNQKWINLQNISSPSTMPRWSSKINKKLIVTNW